jgi:hypothetical protein
MNELIVKPTTYDNFNRAWLHRSYFHTVLGDLGMP